MAEEANETTKAPTAAASETESTATATTATTTTTSTNTSPTPEQQVGDETNKRKNFKNLTISVQQHQQQTIIPSNSMKCQCAHYFNTETTADPSLSTENIPSTVKSMSPDSCCTYGTHYPNRIFVGHLPGKANATDLADYFRSYGTVLEGKVVLDSFGRSRRFGFVTFATHDDVQNVLAQGPVFFKGKKINVGPAVKRMFGTEFSPPMSPAPDSTASSSDDETGGETIVTVPPVNDTKDPSTPSTPKSGNVWLKINSKPKLTPKKTMEKQQFVYPTVTTAHHPHHHNQQQQQQLAVTPTYQQQQMHRYHHHPQQAIQHHRQAQQLAHHQQQQQQQQPQYYYFTVPCNQAYAYQGAYYTQSPVYYGETGQPMVMSPQWSMPPSVYLPGSLSVA